MKHYFIFVFMLVLNGCASTKTEPKKLDPLLIPPHYLEEMSSDTHN